MTFIFENRSLLLYLFLQSSSVVNCLTFRAYVLRHGQTDANAAEVEQGSADFSRLTELGKQQAADAYRAFCEDDNIRITSIYSSPLNRARSTLEELRRQDEMSSVQLFPSSVTVLENLREIDLYDWQGQKYAVLEEKFPDSWRAWREGNADKMIVYDTKQGQAPIERYPLLEMWERADKVWDEIFQHEQEKSECDAPDKTDRAALIVAHGNLGQALLGTAMGWDANQFNVHMYPNTGIAEILFGDYPIRPKTAERWRWKWPTTADRTW